MCIYLKVITDLYYVVTNPCSGLAKGFELELVDSTPANSSYDSRHLHVSVRFLTGLYKSSRPCLRIQEASYIPCFQRTTR